MSQQQETFQQNLARKNVILAAGFILMCLTIVSLVASFMIYRESFRDCWPLS